MAESSVSLVDDIKKQITIETPRLILRAAMPSDAIPLHEAFSDPEVMRYCYVPSSTPPHPTLETTQSWITSMITSSQNGLKDFIITLKPSSDLLPSPARAISTSPLNPTVPIESPPSTPPSTPPLPIGKIGIYRPPPSNELGFLLSRPHWGKGLAKEAMIHTLKYLFLIPLPPPSLLPSGKSCPSSSSPSSSSSSSAPLVSRPPTPQVHPQETSQPEPQPQPQPQIQNYTTLSVPELHSQLQNSASRYQYPSITADVDPRNAASRGILKGMGFHEVTVVKGTDFIGGEWVDSVYLRVERGKWLGEWDCELQGKYDGLSRVWEWSVESG